MVTCPIVINAEKIIPADWKAFKGRCFKQYKTMREAIKRHGKNRIAIGFDEKLNPLALFIRH